MSHLISPVVPSAAAVILLFLFFPSLCYGVEDNPPSNAFVGFHRQHSPSVDTVASGPVSGNGKDDKYGRPDERPAHFIGTEWKGRPRMVNWMSGAEPIRFKRSSTSTNGRRLQRHLAEVPDVLYDRRPSRLLYPGDLKYIYDSGYEAAAEAAEAAEAEAGAVALDDPSGPADVGHSPPDSDDGPFDWRNPGGIGDDGAEGIWKTFQELSFLNDPELSLHSDSKRKWKSKNMAMWG